MVPKRNQINSFRRYSPQVLACFAKNMLLLNFTLAVNLSTIIIPALKGLNPKNNPNEHITITPEEETWIASLFSLFVVFGSLMTSFLDPLGRKKSIILCHIPFFVGWIYLYYSNSVWDIYVTLAIFGLFSGLSEAPTLNYIGEISEPTIRAILSSTTNFAFEIGATSNYFLASQMPWRNVVLIYTSVPIIGIFAMLFVPETPQWLLSHNRTADALKSLQWFRGWAKPSDVENEFNNLERYKTVANVCYECEKQNMACEHPQPTAFGRFRELFRRKTFIPCLLIIILGFNGIIGGKVFRPYIVPILVYYKSPIDPNEVLVWIGYFGVLANILTMIIVRSVGKRRINLYSLGIVITFMYAIGAYGFLYLNANDDESLLRYLPVFGFTAIFFLNSFGLRSMTNLMLAEIFPYRSKSLAAGVGLAAYYMNASITSKTFNTLQEALTLPGQCVFYATIAVFGFVIVYLMVPETEGRSLEDIEMYFSNKKRKFNNIHIPSISNQEK